MTKDWYKSESEGLKQYFQTGIKTDIRSRLPRKEIKNEIADALTFCLLGYTRYGEF